MATTHLPPDFKELLKLLNAQRVVDVLDGVKVSLISLKHLKANKKASGRHQDLADLENLP
jgi:hypothetical protein